MNSITLKTYAKINLSLDVTGVREDGYHLVRMVMQAVDLCDDMVIRVFGSKDPKITLKSNKYYVPTDRRNTAYKAAELMIEACRKSRSSWADQPFEVRIDIGKNIPVAAGLAGGSSNAAGAIIGLNRVLDMRLKPAEMCAIGSRIGADVPFSIMSMLAAMDGPDLREGGISTAALAEGVGEVLTPLHPISMWTVLVKPHFSVSTKDVYQALDAIEISRHPDTEAVLRGMKTGDANAIANGMANVLEEVTLVQHPRVAEVKSIMQKHCPDLTMMSGSGPTVYSLFSEKKAAESAYRKLQDELRGLQCSVYLAKTL